MINDFLSFKTFHSVILFTFVCIRIKLVFFLKSDSYFMFIFFNKEKLKLKFSASVKHKATEFN